LENISSEKRAQIVKKADIGRVRRSLAIKGMSKKRKNSRLALQLKQSASAVKKKVAIESM